MSNVFTESHTKERGYEKTLARKSWNKMAGDSADGNLLEASGCLVGPDSHVCDKRSYICMCLLLGGEKNRGIILTPESLLKYLYKEPV